jgi:hypothetical protein
MRFRMLVAVSRHQQSGMAAKGVRPGALRVALRDAGNKHQPESC